MRLCQVIAIALGWGAVPLAITFGTPASSPPFRTQDFLQADSSSMWLESGLDMLGWRSTYQMLGYEPGRFAVNRAVNIRRRTTQLGGREWTFEEDVMFRGVRQIHRNLELRSWVHADLYSDEFQRQMHWIQQGIGVAVKPVRWGEIYPAFGLHEDCRQGFRDKGSLLASSVSIDPESWGTGHISWGVEELGDRQNRDLEMNYRIRGDFQEDTFDEFEAGYQQQKRNYYLSPSGDIARREEINRNLQNRLGYPLGRGHDLLITFRARDSKVHIISGGSRNDHREVETAVQLSLHTLWKHYNGQLIYEWNAQDQEFDEDRINGRHQALRASGTVQLSEVDRLSFHASLVKNIFDTPDTLNFDDRDDWSTRLSVTYSRPLNRYLTWSQDATVYLDHLVYIYAEKSENNHWRRVFRLASSLISTPYPGVENRNGFLVTATYRDYDFDNPEQPRSDVYRRFTAVDSLKLPLQPHLNFLVVYQLDLEDRGLLDWSEWIQQISEEYRYQRFQFGLSYQSPLGWRLSWGWIETKRLGWRYSTTGVNQRTKSQFQDIRTSGPTASCTWSGFERMIIRATGQWQWIEDLERNDQSILFADINLLWYF